MIKHILIWLFVMLPMILIGFIFLPLALLLVPRDATKLPWYLKPWDNYNRSGTDVLPPTRLYDGIDGDEGYAAKTEGWHWFWARYNWLALRNPINTFKFVPWGVKAPKSWDEVDSVKGDIKSANTGSSYYEIKVGKHWELYVEKPWFGSKYYFRLRAGWKLKNEIDRGSGFLASWVLSVTPFKKLP